MARWFPRALNWRKQTSGSNPDEVRIVGNSKRMSPWFDVKTGDESNNTMYK